MKKTETRNNNKILYFNALTQQLQVPITESAEEHKTDGKNRKQKIHNERNIIK
jgi:hypothetical protein